VVRVSCRNQRHFYKESIMVKVNCHALTSANSTAPDVVVVEVDLASLEQEATQLVTHRMVFNRLRLTQLFRPCSIFKLGSKGGDIPHQIVGAIKTCLRTQAAAQRKPAFARTDLSSFVEEFTLCIEVINAAGNFIPGWLTKLGLVLINSPEAEPDETVLGPRSWAVCETTNAAGVVVRKATRKSERWAEADELWNPVVAVCINHVLLPKDSPRRADLRKKARRMFNQHLERLLKVEAAEYYSDGSDDTHLLYPVSYLHEDLLLITQVAWTPDTGERWSLDKEHLWKGLAAKWADTLDSESVNHALRVIVDEYSKTACSRQPKPKVVFKL